MNTVICPTSGLQELFCSFRMILSGVDTSCHCPVFRHMWYGTVLCLFVFIILKVLIKIVLLPSSHLLVCFQHSFPPQRKHMLLKSQGLTALWKYHIQGALHSVLGHYLQCWHYVSGTKGVPAALLQIQLPVCAAEGQQRTSQVLAMLMRCWMEFLAPDSNLARPRIL